MIAWLLVTALVALPTRPWLERDGSAVVVSADLSAMFDADLRARLTSGLTTTLRLKLELRDIDDDELVGLGWRVAQVRWDLWDEQLATVVDSPTGVERRTWGSVDGFVTAFTRIDRLPIAAALPPDDRVVRAVLRLEINPVSAEKLARMRRWLSAPEGQVVDPFSSGLLGSFVRLFDNLKPGVAERVVSMVGQPVRADRLPLVSPAAPPAAPTPDTGAEPSPAAPPSTPPAGGEG